MNNKVNKFKCSLGSHPFKILKIDKNLEIKICKVCGKILEETWYIKCEVAKNLNTPKEVLVKLSKDEDWAIRCLVVLNPNTPVKVLIELSKDKSWRVRYYVTQNLKNKRKNE